MSETENKPYADQGDIARQIKQRFVKIPVPKSLKDKTRFEAELLINPHKEDKYTVEAKAAFQAKFEEYKLKAAEYANVKVKLVEMKRPVFRAEPNFMLVLIVDVEDRPVTFNN